MLLRPFEASGASWRTSSFLNPDTRRGPWTLQVPSLAASYVLDHPINGANICADAQMKALGSREQCCHPNPLLQPSSIHLIGLADFPPRFSRLTLHLRKSSTASGIQAILPV